MKKFRRAVDMFPIVEAFMESGMTQKAFTEQNNLNKDVFTYWKTKWKNSKNKTEKQARATFVEVKPKNAQVDNSIGIKYYGAEILINTNDEVQLSRVLKAIKNAG